MPKNTHALEHVLDQLIELGKQQDEVTVGDMRAELAQRSFGPFLFVPALLEISPIGGVPGVPTFLGLIVAIAAVQLVLGRTDFWLPQVIVRRGVKGDRMVRAMEKMRKLARVIDKLLRPRLGALTGAIWTRLAGLLAVLCMLGVPPLELVPFASTVPFAAIALIGLGLMGRDGLFMLLGMVVATGAIAVVVFQLLV